MFRKVVRKQKTRKREESEDEAENEIKGDLEAQQTKRKMAQINTFASTKHTVRDETIADPSLGVAFESSGTAQSITQNTATRTLDLDDHQPITTNTATENIEDIDKYIGMANYKQYIPNAKTQQKTFGPIRNASYVRISSRFDYAMDVCKDYKDSGYCGFGDSCKFMHDRSDYKSGWEIEKEWEQKQKSEAIEETDLFNMVQEVAVEEGEDLPFACLICRGDFRNPVVTKCGHYFCETCALKEFSRNSKCAACGANTNGAFNVAKNLIAKLKEKKIRVDAREAKIREDNRGNEDLEVNED